MRLASLFSYLKRTRSLWSQTLQSQCSRWLLGRLRQLCARALTCLIGALSSATVSTLGLNRSRIYPFRSNITRFRKIQVLCFSKVARPSLAAQSCSLVQILRSLSLLSKLSRLVSRQHVYYCSSANFSDSSCLKSRISYRRTKMKLLRSRKQLKRQSSLSKIQS